MMLVFPMKTECGVYHKHTNINSGFIYSLYTPTEEKKNTEYETFQAKDQFYSVHNVYMDIECDVRETRVKQNGMNNDSNRHEFFSFFLLAIFPSVVLIRVIL